jgi:hypothetical protein
MRVSIGILLLVLFFSCKKEEPDYPEIPPHGMCVNNRHSYYMPADISHQKFRLNSWWVYLDSVSMQTDSCRVDAILYEGMGGGPNICDYYEQYCFSVHHYADASKDSIFLMVNCKFVGRPAYYSLHATYQAYSTIPTGGTSYFQSPTTDSLLKTDSMFIYDRYYYKVVISKMQTDPAEDSLHTISYSNSDYGLLRKDVFNPNGTLKNKWLLKNKNVIR